jgi:AcrR family transcriptional regulator
MKKRHPYMSKVRAAQSARSRARIIDSVITLMKSRFREQIPLEDVADGAQMTEQTIKNKFGSKAALFDAALVEVHREAKELRHRARPEELEAGIAGLVGYYERLGDLLFRNRAEEGDLELVETAREGYRQWVKRQFASQLGQANAQRRKSLTDALECVCDVYTWTLLRRDMGRSRPDTEQAILGMVNALFGQP